MKRDPNFMKLSGKSLLPAALLAAATLVSCRGQLSEKPPIQLQQNMYYQERFNPQEANPFFEDGMAMRAPIEGTVARGELREDTRYYEGVDENGRFVDENPLDLSRELLERGRDRYDIYCAVCHGGIGDGQGVIMVGQYGYVPAPSFHTDQLRDIPDGQIYSAIYNGVRTMPSYRTQIPVEDRWAIVAWVRTLQLSQNASADLLREYGVDVDQLDREYQAMLQEQEEQAAAAAATPSEAVGSAEEGQQIFTRQGCQACHSTEGVAMIGPALNGVFGREVELTDGATLTADEEYIRESIVNPGAKIVAGYSNMMPPYSHLNEQQLLSLVEYIKSLAGN